MILRPKLLLFAFLVIGFILLGVNYIALANTPTAPPAAPGACKGNTFLGFPTWYQYLPLDGSCNINTQGQNHIPILIAIGIFDIILYLAAFLAVIMIFYGGFKYLTSNGDSGKITEGKNTIINALIGMAIALIASQFVGFLAGRLT